MFGWDRCSIGACMAGKIREVRIDTLYVSSCTNVQEFSTPVYSSLFIRYSGCERDICLLHSSSSFLGSWAITSF